MSVELEDRLERLGDALPSPTAEARERVRSAALAALSPSRRRRRRRALLLAPAAVAGLAAAVVAVLAAPWQESPLATERALAALGDLPVVHAIVEHSRPHEVVIDLASGGERRVAHRSEYWYDDERDLLRVRLSVAGELLPGAEYVHSPEGFFTDLGRHGQPGPPQLDPALEGFASGYRAALESGKATVVGEDVVDGREAVILRLSLDPVPSGERISEEVAVDADDYRPLRFRFSSSVARWRTTPWSEAFRVVEIESVPRDPRDFKAPQRGEPRPAEQTGVDERTLTPSEAATALERPAYWPGPAVGGVELTQIELMRLTTRWTGGNVTKGHALVFQYGADRRTAHLERKPSLLITQGTSPYETPRFGLFGAASALRPGELRLTGFRHADGSEVDMWFGSMRRDGVYLSFESSQRDLIVTAARALEPLR